MNRIMYFISSGTSSNDIGKSGKNNLSYFGYKQLCNLRKNDYFFKNILSQNIEILTSSDRNCVESSLILFSDVNQRTVNVVPYLSNKRDKNANHTQLFKRNLATGTKKHHLETLNFGENHNLQILIENFPIINVDLKTNGKNYYFNPSKFMTLLEHKINASPGIIVVLCDSSIIRTILRKLSSAKYREIKDESFEKSSIWEVEFDFNTKGEINYELFSKKYPIKENYEPLEKEGNNFLCEFKGSYIPLFEKSSDISDDLLKKISSSAIDNRNTKKNSQKKTSQSIINKSVYSIISNQE